MVSKMEKIETHFIDDGPYCHYGRCCDSSGQFRVNESFATCIPDSWYPGDFGSIPPAGQATCPIYGGGIGRRTSDVPEYFVTVGPTSLTPFPNALSNTPMHKLGDDYDATGVGGPGDFIELEYFRFVGGVTDSDNAHVAFEFYDVNGTFVEDVDRAFL